MRILPAKTELRKQHYCQIVPLEVLTGKSYQSKIWKHQAVFQERWQASLKVAAKFTGETALKYCETAFLTSGKY